ncbi:hypothetical protein D3C81_2252660 [compost metagenome]
MKRSRPCSQNRLLISRKLPTGTGTESFCALPSRDSDRAFSQMPSSKFSGCTNWSM